MDKVHVSSCGRHYKHEDGTLPTVSSVLLILLLRVKAEIHTAVAWKGQKREHDAVWHYNGKSTLSSSLGPW